MVMVIILLRHTLQSVYSPHREPAALNGSQHALLGALCSAQSAHILSQISVIGYV